MKTRSAVPGARASATVGLRDAAGRPRRTAAPSERWPATPTVVVAASRLLSTASSVASTAAAKYGSRSRPGDRRAGRRPGRAARADRSPGPGRSRRSPWCAGAAGAGQPEAGPAGQPLAAGRVQRPVGDDDARCTTRPARRPGASGGRSCAPTGTPATVSRSASPKFASTSDADGVAGRARPATPCRCRPSSRSRSCPVPAPTAPSSGGSTVPTEARAADSASRTSSWVTCIRRASLRNESSHSATSGMTTSSTPIAGSSSASSSQAAS